MRYRRDRGFTLIEVLIALLIAAAALGVLYQGALAGLLSTRVSSHVVEASARARSHLAVVGHGSAIVPGDQEGDDGSGYRWRLSVRQTQVAPVVAGDPVTVARGPHAALYAVTVWIAWQEDGSAREVRLDTERVGLAPQASP
jgi:general secretion pathway protein I